MPAQLSSGTPTEVSSPARLYALTKMCRHDWGGYVAIAAAATHPHVVRRIAVLCVPHMRAFMSLPLLQIFRSWFGGCLFVWINEPQHRSHIAPRYVFLFQLPFLPHRMLPACNFAFVDLLYYTWSTSHIFSQYDLSSSTRQQRIFLTASAERTCSA
jgi:pimeloyl-ACP methyl ester carboxylesterase